MTNFENETFEIEGTIDYELYKAFEELTLEELEELFKEW